MWWYVKTKLVEVNFSNLQVKSIVWMRRGFVTAHSLCRWRLSISIVSLKDQYTYNIKLHSSLCSQWGDRSYLWDSTESLRSLFKKSNWQNQNYFESFIWNDLWNGFHNYLSVTTNELKSKNVRTWDQLSVSWEIYFHIPSIQEHIGHNQHYLRLAGKRARECNLRNNRWLRFGERMCMHCNTL